ncbi:hypothetical protein GGF32_004279 [Allomyces javanicus]|nr:hypothetical protein GGF32_004279 [Allomyces javanicus]
MAKWFDCFSAALGGFLFGYSSCIIASVLEMDSFTVFFGMADADAARMVAAASNPGIVLVKTASYSSIKAQIVSFFVLGCIPGALAIAFLGDALGRRRSIWLGSFLFSVSAIIQAVIPESFSVAQRTAMVLAGRFIGGSGIGILSTSVPLYIAEIAPTALRGRLTSIQQLMITIGIAFAFIVNAIIIGSYKANHDLMNDSMWRTALALQAAPGALLMVMLVVMPESPRWLMLREREEEALTNLARLRQQDERSPAVQEEFHDYKQSIETERQVGTAAWSELGRKGILNRVGLGIALQFFQQWTGINAVLYYSASLFIAMGIPKSTAITVNVVVQSLINVLFTVPGMYLIERSGRKNLLVWGGLAMAVCMWLLVLFVNLFQSSISVPVDELTELTPIPTSARTYSIISVIAMYCYVACFASTWGPVVWVYQSEIFPLRVRSKGTGIAAASNWINNFILSYVWPYAETLGANQYIVFGTTGLAMAAFTAWYVPETRGKSLEEMDEVFGFAEDAAYPMTDLKAQ